MPQRLLTILRPPELPQSDDPAELHRYHVATARYHFNLTITVAALLVVSVWAASPYGFARVDMLQSKIDASVAPVVERVEGVETTVDKISADQKTNANRVAKALSNTVASDIRFIQARLCNRSLSNAERDAYHREIANKQDEYRDLRGFEYNVPRCEDL